MKLDAAISLAEDIIRPSIREERAWLISEIEAMRRRHAAKGLLKSGATLKRIRDLGIESLFKRIEIVFSALRASIEQVVPPVKDFQVLMPIIISYIPEDLDDQGVHIRKAVADLNVPNALPQLLNALTTARANALQKAEANLKLFIAKHALAHSPSSEPHVFGIVEIVLLAITVGLAWRWIKNPSGLYEPYLVLVAAVAAAIELVRKRRRK